MAYILNGNQQVRVRGLQPIPVYSRVVSLRNTLPADNAWYWNVTGPLGNDLWLLEVKVFSMAKAVNAANYSQFRIYTGSGVVNAMADFDAWDNVLPLHFPAGALGYWRIEDGRDEISWTMAKTLRGENRRLGYIARRPIGMGVDIITVSYQISEG